MGHSMFSGGATGFASQGSNVFGILYAEDFDNPSELDASDVNPKAATPPAITQADVDAACAAAVEAARARWTHESEQMRSKATASIAAALIAIRDANAEAAMDVAEAAVTTILSIVTGLLPHFSREHGPEEVRALLGHLLPTIRSQTKINVRVHADLVNVIQRDIDALEVDQPVDITAAPLEPGDVKVSWENGALTRNSRKIMQSIQDALGELGLQQPVETSSKKRMAYAE